MFHHLHDRRSNQITSRPRSYGIGIAFRTSKERHGLD
jgi:hypothetical protein